MESPLRVDASGRPCPVPILELARAVRTSPPGTQVELCATDPAIEPDLKAWCEATGHRLVWIRRDADGWRARVCVMGHF